MANLPDCIQCTTQRPGSRPADSNWPSHCGSCARSKGAGAAFAHLLASKARKNR